MLSIFDPLRDVTLLSVAVRMLLAVLCGGAIGIEREYKRRPAGFRTHILICLGAAMVSLTSEFLFLYMKYYLDISRMSAAVASGIGFIGAGTIIVTNRQRVKGLTTAAGLWTSAIIGLVCGAGYVECAIFATLMVLVAELLLVKIEYRFARKLTDVNLYVEYYKAETIENIVRVIREKRIKMSGLEISRVTDEDGRHRYSAVATVQINKRKLDDELVKSLTDLENVLAVEEL